jgi:GNAT superfamily N-acetyltransferase
MRSLSALDHAEIDSTRRAAGTHAGQMEVRLHDSIDEFNSMAGPLYRRDPITNTIELTLLQAGELPDGSLLLTVWDSGDLIGAAIQTPPYPLACNALPIDSAGVVAAEVARVNPELAGARGARAATAGFAAAWNALTGSEGHVSVEERLYRLRSLRPPVGVQGDPCRATDQDRGLLVDWVEGFYAETFGHPRDDEAGRRFVDAAERKGDRFTLWTVDDVPVSMAMLRAPAADVSRIGPVFTPPERRGHGYGSAVTAAAVELAHRSGTADVVLFTDLANPVSNAIYQRIGFEAVADSVRIDFRLLG